jgi:cytochrome c peroxidase
MSKVQYPFRKHLTRAASAGILLLSLSCGVVSAQDNDASPTQLRRFIDQQVGGIDKVKVPATDAGIPVPPGYRYQTTEAKRYLGKLLFHDPVRSARINRGNYGQNEPQPSDLPAGTAFGGTVSDTIPNLQEIVNAQFQKTSCGSCHIGEAASKAGQVLSLASGAEGRGYTDEHGNFFPRRRPQSILTKLRSVPIFPGDTLVDALPTLADVDLINGQRVVTIPANFYHQPPPQALLQTGRLDELDSVGRQAMSLIGFAFNNRLLFGGIGGEPPATPGSLNPFNDPAGENMTLLLLDAHRMLHFQSAELQKIPAFVKLFRDAFPVEASSGNINDLINDDTEFRAQATFLRTVVTRNTPFDKFLAGDDRALTPEQLRGAKLFFTPAANSAGGAGCFTCHSGPILNKQFNDPDVAGIGAFVEENFFNIGIGDHPVQALNALARGHLNPANLGKDGFPYHAEDTGRQEITHSSGDAFKFRALTLRRSRTLGPSSTTVRSLKSVMSWSTSTPGFHKTPLPAQCRLCRPGSRIPAGLVTREAWGFRNSKSTISSTSWRTVCTIPRSCTTIPTRPPPPCSRTSAISLTRSTAPTSPPWGPRMASC